MTVVSSYVGVGNSQEFLGNLANRAVPSASDRRPFRSPETQREECPIPQDPELQLQLPAGPLSAAPKS